MDGHADAEGEGSLALGDVAVADAVGVVGGHAEGGVELVEDTLALVEAVARPGLRMMLDLYHAQLGEGNLIQLLKRADSLIGEVQVADVPGRCEPGTGEINFTAIAAALKAMGYRGTVGLEAYAAGDDNLAFERFSAVFGAETTAQQQPSDT